VIPTGRRALLGDLRSVLLPWTTARLLVAAAYGLARLLEGGSGSRTSRGLIAWDGDWYISILTHGYDGVTREGAASSLVMCWLGDYLTWCCLEAR